MELTVRFVWGFLKPIPALQAEWPSIEPQLATDSARKATSRRNSAFEGPAVAIGMTLLLALSGCGGGPKGPRREAVFGTVTREGQLVDSGQLMFTPASGGPGASHPIVDGKYAFTAENGPVAGKHKVSIIHFPPRAEAPPGTPKKDAEILPETRFKKKMPAKGWDKEVEIKTDQKEPVDFHIDE